MKRQLGNLLIVAVVIAGAWLSYRAGMVAFIGRMMKWTAVVMGVGAVVAVVIAVISGTAHNRRRAREAPRAREE